MPPAFPWARFSSCKQWEFKAHTSFAAHSGNVPSQTTGLHSSPHPVALPLPPRHRQSILTHSPGRALHGIERVRTSWCFVAREMEPHPMSHCLFADIPRPCLHFPRLEVPDQSTPSPGAPGTTAQTLDF